METVFGIVAPGIVVFGALAIALAIVVGQRDNALTRQKALAETRDELTEEVKTLRKQLDAEMQKCDDTAGRLSSALDGLEKLRGDIKAIMSARDHEIAIMNKACDKSEERAGRAESFIAACAVARSKHQPLPKWENWPQ